METGKLGGTPDHTCHVLLGKERPLGGEEEELQVAGQGNDRSTTDLNPSSCISYLEKEDKLAIQCDPKISYKPQPAGLLVQHTRVATLSPTMLASILLRVIEPTRDRT